MNLCVLMTVWRVKGFTFTAVSHFFLVRGVLALNCQTVYMFYVSVSLAGSIYTDLYIESRAICQ